MQKEKAKTMMIKCLPALTIVVDEFIVTKSWFHNRINEDRWLNRLDCVTGKEERSREIRIMKGSGGAKPRMVGRKRHGFVINHGTSPPRQKVFEVAMSSIKSIAAS